VKLLISWSGDRSKHIALALHRWLPTVIQSLDPWMSDIDLGKGTDWNQELSSKLEGTAFGVLCLTRENLTAPWLLFEAGAIGKRPGTKRVYTYLFQLMDSDVSFPLAQFQSTKATQDDTHKMLVDMNSHLQQPLDKAVLQTTFNRGWPELKEALDKVSKVVETPQSKDKVELMLEEILTYVRQQSRRDEQALTEARAIDEAMARERERTLLEIEMSKRAKDLYLSQRRRAGTTPRSLTA